MGIYPINYSVAHNELHDTGKDAPIGYKALNVSLDAYVLVLPKSIAKGYIETMESLGVSILDAYVSPYANSYLLLEDSDQKNGAFLVDLGSNQTNLSYFKDHLLIANFKIKFGSDYISE